MFISSDRANKAPSHLMRKRGWHPTGFSEAVISAAIASRILKLDTDSAVMAVSIAAFMGGGLSQNIGTMGMGLHAGTACRNGINAAMLAKSGFICDRHPLAGRFGLLDALCGPGEYAPASLIKDLGKPFRVLDPGIAIKPYPNCWAHHKVYDSVMELKHTYNIDPDQVKEIHVDLQTDKPTYRYTCPETDLEARYSLGYGIARILLEGRPDLEQYEDGKIRREDVRAMMSRIVDTPARGDQKQKIVIIMNNGKQYSDQRTFSKGHPLFAPLSEEELKAKYMKCACRFLSEEKAEATYGMMFHLEELQDMGTLMDLLTL